MKTETKLELYLHPKQKDSWIQGFDLEKYLKDKGLIKRCLSLEDKVVKGWIKNPETYSEEYKNIHPFLWGSVEDCSGRRDVAYLYWHDGRVIVSWRWLEDRWHSNNPALLASSSSETLPSSDTSTLDSAIKICKENGLVIYKPL